MADKLVAGTTSENGLVAESDLMYEAPDNSPDFDLKSAENDFIRSMTQGGAFDEIEQEVGDETDQPEAEVDPQGEPLEQTETETESEVEDEVEDPKLARGISRVVQRELAAKAEREAADRSIAEMKAMKAELEQYKGLKQSKDLAEMMGIDPLGAFKNLGHDPDTVIKLALAQQLGDQAPDKLKEFAREAATKREIAALKAQLAQEAQNRRAQEYFNEVQMGADTYVAGLSKEVKPGKKVGDSTPTLTTVAVADPAYVRDEIMEEIVNEAKKQAVRDPDGQPISYEEAAKRVEARWSKLAKIFAGNVSSKNPGAALVKPNQKAPPQTKPTPKPLMPWQRTNSLEEDGLREAMREYERQENARKVYRK